MITEAHQSGGASEAHEIAPEAPRRASELPGTATDLAPLTGPPAARGEVSPPLSYQPSDVRII